LTTGNIRNSSNNSCSYASNIISSSSNNGNGNNVSNDFCWPGFLNMVMAAFSLLRLEIFTYARHVLPIFPIWVAGNFNFDFECGVLGFPFPTGSHFLFLPSLCDTHGVSTLARIVFPKKYLDKWGQD